MRTYFDDLNVVNLSSETLNSINLEDYQKECYSIPMIVAIGIKFSENIVDNVPRYSSADHISCFKTLIALLTKIITNENSEKFTPYYQNPISIDENFCSSFLTYYQSLLELNMIVSVKEGIWNASHIDDKFYMSINPEHRRNALHLVGNKANYFSYSKSIQKLLAEKPVDTVKLALEEQLETLDPLTKSLPSEWTSLLSYLNITKSQIVSFNAFISFLIHRNITWFTKETLKEELDSFSSSNDQEILTKESFESLCDLFIITVNEASNWGISAPFISINSKYFFYWPYYQHILHPCLSIINLIHRKKSKEWSLTLGTGLSQTASYLVSQLVKHENIFFASEQSKTGLGDIDIGIYDVQNDHLCLIEVKTVFDKFRTNYQYSNFAFQKINFHKVKKQLDNNEEHIKSGNWTLQEIFKDSKLLGRQPPKTISKLLLTWWDIISVPKSVAFDILSCNFIVFKYMWNKSNGNLTDFCNSITDLSRLYCPYIQKKLTYTGGGANLELIREIQTDILPPKKIYVQILQTNLALTEVDDIAKLPDNWELLENNEHLNLY